MSNTTTLGELLKDYEGDIECLPAGTYQFEIVNVKARATDVIPTLKALQGPYAGKKAMCGVVSWNGNAAPRAFARMREVGLDKAFFAGLGAEHLPIGEVMKAVSEALKGRVVEADLTVEEPNKYHDDYRNKLEKWKLVSAPALPAQAGIPQVPQAPAAPAVAVAPATPTAAPTVAETPTAVSQATIAVTPQVPGVVPVVAPAAPQAPPVAAEPQAAPAAAPAVAPVPGVPVVSVATQPPTVPAAAPAVAPTLPVAEAPAAPPVAVGAPVAATIQVADEPDF